MNQDLQIERAIELLSKAHHVVALTGAGISTPSGIPDYRSPKSGLWERAEDMMEVASSYGFRHNPQAFYNWIRPLMRVVLDAMPNPAHFALAQLEAAGLLKAVITQNIDLLHGRAGSRNVLEVHGQIREAICPACHHIIPAAPLMEQFMNDGKIPRCERCHHIMKPNVVLFGELLPMAIMKAAQTQARTADLMLVAGSSLEVAPAGDLPELARRNGAKLIIINFMETHLDHLADVIIRADVADVLPRLVAPFIPPPVIEIDPVARPLDPGLLSKNPPLGDVSRGG
ncbi:MAG: NAD-dependent deacylase [Candidatus Promineofilum sp.]|nr:NAD-dependent deacylase [Promineifilum sp.]